MKVFIGLLVLAAAAVAEDVRFGAHDEPNHHIDERKINELLKKNSEELGKTNSLLRSLDTINDQIKLNLEQQKEAIKVIGGVEEQLAKQSTFLDAQSVVLLEAFANISHKSEHFAERTGFQLLGLARLQGETKSQIISLERKLEAYQKQVVNSASCIDRSILELTKLVTRTVLPKLDGLKYSFDSLDTSQINIEVDLKSLARVKATAEDSNVKLGILEGKLRSLNRSQDQRLDALINAVKRLAPLKTWEIEQALRHLILSQKRIELDLEACDKRRALSGPKTPQHLLPLAHNLEIEVSEPKSRPVVPKPIDLVPVYNIKEPEQSSVYYAQAYAKKPKSRPEHGQRSPPKNGEFRQSVSWQEPLPWETVAQYPTAPKPAPSRQPHEQRGGEPKQPCPKTNRGHSLPEQGIWHGIVAASSSY